jgi:hypothetical protein
MTHLSQTNFITQDCVDYTFRWALLGRSIFNYDTIAKNIIKRNAKTTFFFGAKKYPMHIAA